MKKLAVSIISVIAILAGIGSIKSNEVIYEPLELDFVRFSNLSFMNMVDKIDSIVNSSPDSALFVDASIMFKLPLRDHNTGYISFTTAFAADEYYQMKYMARMIGKRIIILMDKNTYRLTECFPDTTDAWADFEGEKDTEDSIPWTRVLTWTYTYDPENSTFSIGRLQRRSINKIR